MPRYEWTKLSINVVCWYRVNEINENVEYTSNLQALSSIVKIYSENKKMLWRKLKTGSNSFKAVDSEPQKALGLTVSQCWQFGKDPTSKSRKSRMNIDHIRAEKVKEQIDVKKTKEWIRASEHEKGNLYGIWKPRIVESTRFLMLFLFKTDGASWTERILLGIRNKLKIRLKRIINYYKYYNLHSLNGDQNFCSQLDIFYLDPLSVS